MTEPQLPDAERLALCAREIAEAGRELGARGWTPATSSNFSRRYDDTHAAVTISGRDKGRLGIDDIMLVDLDGNAVATWALLFQAVYIVAFTYVLWFWLVQRYPASGLSSFTFLTPVFGVLFGGLLLGEPLGATIFLALGLIVAGLVLVNRSPKQPISVEQ